MRNRLKTLVGAKGQFALISVSVLLLVWAILSIFDRWELQLLSRFAFAAALSFVMFFLLANRQKLWTIQKSVRSLQNGNLGGASGLPHGRTGSGKNANQTYAVKLSESDLQKVVAALTQEMRHELKSVGTAASSETAIFRLEEYARHVIATTAALHDSRSER